MKAARFTSKGLSLEKSLRRKKGGGVCLKSLLKGEFKRTGVTGAPKEKAWKKKTGSPLFPY